MELTKCNYQLAMRRLEQITRFADGRWTDPKNPDGFLSGQPRMVDGKVYLVQDPDFLGNGSYMGVPRGANAYEVLSLDGADEFPNENYGKYAIIFYQV